MGAIIDNKKYDDLIPYSRKTEQVIIAMIGESVRYRNRDIVFRKAHSRHEKACDKDDSKG